MASETREPMRARPWPRRRLCLLAALTVGLSVLSASSLASAADVAAGAFPGKNGLIAFNSDGSVYVVEPDGSGLRQIAQTGIQDGYPGVSFSPGGKLIAFSAMSATDPDIYTVRPDGSGRKPLTFSRGVDSDPTWSGDGKRIAFETDRNGNLDIYSVDSAGRNPRQLTKGPLDEQDPAWSPKGNRIAYTVASKDGLSRQIWVMDGDGANPLPLTDAPNFSENPNWSPDGTRIVFDSDRAEKGDLEIYSIKADGSDIRRLTNNPALDALPAYSPDGKRIVFVSDRLQKDSRRLFTMSAAGAKPKRVVAGDEPNFQMVPDWQPLRLGVREKAPVPPGPPLPPSGVVDKVDPLYDRSDAWSVRMEPGITYRINLSARKGCASIAVYPPATRSFGSSRRVVSRECGGYFTFTPGPDGGGTYSLLVSAPAGTEAIVGYHLQTAAAQPDDQGPGILLSSDAKVAGAVSGRSIDVVDLYRFDVSKLSTVQAAITPATGIQLALTNLDGTRIADASPGSTLRKTLERGTYLLAVSAPGRSGGRYMLSLLVRLVTKTTLTADGKAKVTVPVGQPVVLQTKTTPAPGGGTVRLVLEYQDPLAGWVYRRSWDVSPGSSVQFAPPAVGAWRVRASFFGTRGSSPSTAHLVSIVATTTGEGHG
jgi:dipeptidyl aminopeptidase/acylaminoacyl peptidase